MPFLSPNQQCQNTERTIGPVNWFKHDMPWGVRNDWQKLSTNCAGFIPFFSSEDLETCSETVLGDTVVTAHVTLTPWVALVDPTHQPTQWSSRSTPAHSLKSYLILLLARNLQASRRYWNESGRHFRISPRKLDGLGKNLAEGWDWGKSEWVEFNAPPDTQYVISEVVFTANHLTDTDKQSSTGK